MLGSMVVWSSVRGRGGRRHREDLQAGVFRTRSPALTPEHIPAEGAGNIEGWVLTLDMTVDLLMAINDLRI